MRIPLLHLISTPVPVLNSLGLEVTVGLSSESPWNDRVAPQAYAAYLTLYGPDGTFNNRLHLGDIPPRRRKLFNVNAISRQLFAHEDHLAVVHRIPRRFLDQGLKPEDTIERSPEESHEFAFFRSLVQYAFPGGPNGSVIYETPPGLNVLRDGQPPSNTLSFTSMLVNAQTVNTYLVLIYYSVDPHYHVSSPYTFAFFSPAGQLIATGSRDLKPFTVELIDVARTVPAELLQSCRDAEDGLSCLNYLAFSTHGVTIPLVLNVDQKSGGMSVEHTHPAQHYTCFARAEDKNLLKSHAIAQWPAVLAAKAQSLEPCPVNLLS